MHTGNLFLASKDNDHSVKVGDMGFATEVKGPLNDPCGSPQ